MKKTSNWVLLGLYCLSAYFSLGCGKEPMSKIEPSPPHQGLVSSCGEPLKSGTVLGLIADPGDAMNHRVNLILYHYAQAIRQASLDPALNCYMYEKMVQDVEGKGVSIPRLAQENSGFAFVLNQALRQSIAENNFYPKGEPNVESLLTQSNWDANSYLKDKLLYNSDHYDPAISSPKTLEAPCEAPTPVVLIAQEVDECDDIPGWRGNTEILMSEQEALGGRELVIIVAPTATSQPILRESDSTHEMVSAAKGKGVQSGGDVDIDADLFQIKNGHRYETNSRSDISAGVIAFSFTNATAVEALKGHWLDFAEFGQKVHKDDIAVSKIFTDDLDAFFIPFKIFSPGVSMVYILAYERDWYAPKKDIPVGCNPLNWVGFSTRRKYDHEYYFTDCGFGSVKFFQVGSSWTIENPKCKFVLKRTS